MCEIAVIDPEQAPIQAAHQITGRFHEEQGDGIGVVAVYQDGDEFSYRVYTSIDPHWQTLYAFFSRNYEDAWRFIIHGRAATSGDVNRDTAHPIEVDCQHCDVDYVVHNGHVRNYDNVRSGLMSQGHTFNTGVDTEVIGHKVGEIPDTIEDHDRRTYTFNGNLNYLVLSTDGILVRMGQRYHLTEEFTLTCSLSKFDDYEELGFDRGNSNEWMLVTPNEEGEEPSIETKERNVYSTRRSAGTSGTSSSTSSSSATTNIGYGSGGSNRAGQSWRDDRDTDNEDVTITYEDLAPFKSITAIKVAPGVIRLEDTVEEKTAYIYRDEDPRVYFYYTDEPTPDNIDELEQMAALTETADTTAAATPEGEQVTLDEFPLGEAIAEEVSTTIVEEVDGISAEDIEDVRSEIVRTVYGAAEQSTAAASAGA